MKALITWGGWDGHEPSLVAAQVSEMLQGHGYSTEVFDTLDCFDDPEELDSFDLIVPVWTMSEFTKERSTNVSYAIARGTGLAGCHGGMCDAFRSNVLWQFMTGANWVAHPGGDGVSYTVKITNPSHPLVTGIPDFEINSEQYYLHVDPANHVLATTRFPGVSWYHSPNGAVDMPVAWTRFWGLGRVYYCALGHRQNVIASGPAYDMIDRGLIWAGQGKALSRGNLHKLKEWENTCSNF